MKIVASKQMAGGEVMECSVEGPDPAQLERELQEGLRMMDARLWEMNKRIIKINDKYKTLVKREPRAALWVNDIIMVLTGQQLVKDESVQAAVRAAGSDV